MQYFSKIYGKSQKDAYFRNNKLAANTYCKKLSMPVLKRKYKNFILFSCSTVIIYGIYVLFYGWLLQKGLTMAVDAAASFIIIGISLLFSIYCKSIPASRLSAIFSGLVFIWSALLLVRDFTSVNIPVVFGMSPQTAFCFLCLSACFFFIKVRKYRRIIQGTLHFVTLVASIALIGHWLNIPEFYKMTFIPMALYSSIGFILMSVAASFINHDTGITGLFTGNLIGNIMARRLFIKIFIVILAAGYIRIIAHRNSWIHPEISIALLTVVFSIICLLLIWRTSVKLNNIHVKRKMAEENFRIAVEAAPYALVISDRGGTIITVNDHTRQLYGYKKGELIGNNAKVLIPEKLHEQYDVKRKDFYSSPSVFKLGQDYDICAQRKDGSEFPVEITLTPVKTSIDTFVLATIIDITQRRHQENVIKNQLIELQLKNEELEQFNYISSHDLQEPLRTMSNYIHMLKEDYPGQMSEEIQEHLHTMGHTIDRMSHVVKSLLNFGKLGRNKKLVLTDCNILVDNVIADLGNLIKSTGAKIEVMCEFPVLYAYETELRQLFQNLVSNAIKFRKPDVAPEIKIGCKAGRGYFEFFVSDNGIGIDPKHSDKIFHIFHRLNSDTAYEGHGIGLANCKKITEMHGGRIWVESEPGKGSTFKFQILTLNHE